jgi:hypothetical protein
MQTETHPLESFFQDAVRKSLVEKLGLKDPQIVGYVAHLLCEFAEAHYLHRLQDSAGNRVETIADMLQAADPVYGSAPSFDTERAMRKSIGDYALYMAGLHLDVMESAPNYKGDRAMVKELIKVGKESYSIVSQFNLFEYEKEAPMFARLSECLDRCVLGLALIREEIAEHLSTGLPQN